MVPLCSRSNRTVFEGRCAGYGGICYSSLQVHGPRRVVCRATLDDPELDDLMARMEEQVWDVWVLPEVWDVWKYDVGSVGLGCKALRQVDAKLEASVLNGGAGVEVWVVPEVRDVWKYHVGSVVLGARR